MPHAGLDVEFTDEGSPHYFFRRADGKLALAAFTVVFWPLSAPIVWAALGPRRARAVFVNLGYVLENPGDAARSAEVEHARRSVCAFHWASSVIVVGAVVALSAAMSDAPDGTDRAAVVCWHMCWMQAVASALLLLPRRLSFVGLTHCRAALTDTVPTTTVLIYRLYRCVIPVTYGLTQLAGCDMLDGATRREPLLVLTEEGYALHRAILVAGGLGDFLPPLAAVRRSCADGVLRLPDGAPVVMCRPSTSPPGSEGGQRDAPSEGGAPARRWDAAATQRDVAASRRVALDWWASSAATAAYWLRSPRPFGLMVVSMYISAAAVALPFGLRSVVGVPPLGVTAAQAALFVLLALSDLAVALTFVGPPSGVMAVLLLSLTDAQFRGMAESTCVPLERPDDDAGSGERGGVRENHAHGDGNGGGAGSPRGPGGATAEETAAQRPVRIVPYDFATRRATPDVNAMQRRMAAGGDCFRYTSPLDTVAAVRAMCVRHSVFVRR